jgi:ribulose-phosphate 3-epimerase
MLKCSTSLWSADLANLAAEIRRVEPYSERFHLDVADGHYVKNLLFFPDLVRALRPHTRLPLEIHLMVTDPAEWIQPFAEAGAHGIIFCLDSARDPGSVLKAIRNAGLQAGVSLLISEPVDLLEPLWDQLDVITLVGTAMGIKGASMDSSIPGKVRQLRQILDPRQLHAEIQVDGGIRRETVPALKAAGADFIVPGSLMFKEDPPKMRAWLDSL